MIRWFAGRINIWVILVALLIAGGLLALVVGLFYLFPPPPATATASQPALTMIPGPTPTATQPALTPTPMPTEPVVVNGVTIGVYVKISGTEGSGLRLRDAPGTGSAMRFLGMDEELFLVKDGPKEADGFTWWFLEAPYDPNRSGWAAANYLAVVQAPTPEATKAP